MRLRRLFLSILLLATVVGLVRSVPVTAQGEKVVRLALPEGDANSLDPHQLFTLAETQILNQVYEGLVQYDQKTLQPVPALAEKWELSADGLKYTFHLRKGVKFHNGREFTADDVKFTFNRLIDAKVATTYARSIVIGSIAGFADADAGKATELSGIKVVDPQTVEITLSAPNSAFLPILTMTQAVIVPKEATTDAKKFAESPLGTGPFKFVEWKRQEQITLVANPDYWRGKPQIDRAILRVIPEKSAAMVEFTAGNLDMVSVPPPDIARVRADASLKDRLQDIGVLSSWWMFLNLNQAPLDNVKVRQALNYAVDRDSIVKSVLQGQGVPSNGPIPIGLSPYDPNYKFYSFDLDKAKQLLTEAGFPNGIDLEIRTWTDETENRTLLAIQATWAKANIRAKITRSEYTAYINDMTPCHMQIGTYSWTADYADADNFTLGMMGLGNPTMAGCGFGKIPNYEEPARKALTLPLGKERDALYQQFEKAAVENAVGVFVYYFGRTLLVAPNVKGAWLDALSMIRLYPISIG
jgi:oligopeptide transport system substrate-binding protein